MFCTESIKKGNKADSFKLSTEIHLIQSLIGQTAAMEMRVALRLGSLGRTTKRSERALVPN